MTYTVEAAPGKMKHTFTMLRTTFSCEGIHVVLNDGIIPLRKELMKRTEGGGQTVVSEALRTTMMKGVDYIGKRVQEFTDNLSLADDVTLAERVKREEDYVAKATNKGTTIESLAREAGHTQSDELLQAAGESVHTVSFDYTGETDLDMAQPTPDRVQNPMLREFVVGLDYLAVAMSNSHSADNPKTILATEAALWISQLANLHYIVDSYDPSAVPFYPTAISLNEKETRFNADATHDPLVTAGNAVGEPAGTNAVGGTTA